MRYFIAIITFPISLFISTIRYWPGPIGGFLRKIYWKLRMGRMGKDCIIGEGVYIDNPRCVFLGDNCWIDRNVIILAGKDKPRARKKKVLYNHHYLFQEGEVHIGNRVHIAPFCVLNGIAGISVGNASGLASGVKLYSTSHHYRNVSEEDRKQYLFTHSGDSDQFIISGAITIAAGCAIGLNSVLFPGVHIGKGSWVSAASVVHNSLPPGTILKDGKIKSVDDLSLDID